MAYIEVKNVSKDFTRRNAEGKDSTIHVLDDISFEVEKGEFVCLLGFSGCGKSTFLRCINMLEIPTTGKIILDGQDITNIKDLSLIRRKIGMESTTCWFYESRIP